MVRIDADFSCPICRSFGHPVVIKGFGAFRGHVSQHLEVSEPERQRAVEQALDEVENRDSSADR